MLPPERVQVELLNYQIEAFLASGKLDQACTYLEAAAHHASAIGSERLFQEASSLFQQMQTIWQHERQVQHLADLFL